jgi:hypothetical protein
MAYRILVIKIMLVTLLETNYGLPLGTSAQIVKSHLSKHGASSTAEQKPSSSRKLNALFNSSDVTAQFLRWQA